MLSILGNMFNFIFKRFILYTGFGFIYSFCSILSATLGIFWIPQLSNITSVLNFGFKVKELIESYLPFNWKLPVPDKFKFKKMLVLSLGFLGLPVLTFYYPMWLQDVLVFTNIPYYIECSIRAVLPTYLADTILFVAKPLKHLIYYAFCFSISKFTKKTQYFDYPKFEWRDIAIVDKDKVNNNPITNKEIIQESDYITDWLNFLIYLFKELNLFE